MYESRWLGHHRTWVVRCGSPPLDSAEAMRGSSPAVLLAERMPRGYPSAMHVARRRASLCRAIVAALTVWSAVGHPIPAAAGPVSPVGCASAPESRCRTALRDSLNIIEDGANRKFILRHIGTTVPTDNSHGRGSLVRRELCLAISRSGSQQRRHPARHAEGGDAGRGKVLIKAKGFGVPLPGPQAGTQ